MLQVILYGLNRIKPEKVFLTLVSVIAAFTDFFHHRPEPDLKFLPVLEK